jgi:thioredoxin-like negative regulator of GroEL
MVEHGDSEDGLMMLEELYDQYPSDLQTRLRLAEAYIALDDYEPAFEHLCFALERRAELRRDHQALLDDLVAQAQPPDCAPGSVDSAPAGD